MYNISKTKLDKKDKNFENFNVGMTYTFPWCTRRVFQGNGPETVRVYGPLGPIVCVTTVEVSLQEKVEKNLVYDKRRTWNCDGLPHGKLNSSINYINRDEH